MRTWVYYWASQHLPPRICQWAFDRSADFRFWWGPAPPLSPERKEAV